MFTPEHNPRAVHACSCQRSCQGCMRPSPPPHTPTGGVAWVDEHHAAHVLALLPRRVHLLLQLPNVHGPPLLLIQMVGHECAACSMGGVVGGEGGRESAARACWAASALAGARSWREGADQPSGGALQGPPSHTATCTHTLAPMLPRHIHSAPVLRARQPPSCTHAAALQVRFDHAAPPPPPLLLSGQAGRHAPYRLMEAEYSGYCGMGTRMPSLLLRMTALRHRRTATLAPSVTKMFCVGDRGRPGAASASCAAPGRGVRRKAEAEQGAGGVCTGTMSSSLLQSPGRGAWAPAYLPLRPLRTG